MNAENVKTQNQFWENEVTRLHALQDELNLKILKYKPILEKEVKGKVIESTLYFWTGWNDDATVRVLIFTDKTAAFIVDGKFFTPHAYSDGYITEYFYGLEKNHLLVDNYEEIAEQLQKTGKDFTAAIEKRDAASHLASLLKQAQELAEKLQ
jgi:hypothetical protein